YPRYFDSITRTCSLYFFRSICVKNPQTPSKLLPLPRRTISRASSVISRHGTSSGIPSELACFFISVNHERYLGRFHGSMAPSFSVRPLSGITRFRSKSTVLPKPWQRGQAPNGLLKLNRRGSGSRPGRWQLAH